MDDRNGSGAGGVVRLDRLQSALEALKSQPRPPEMGRAAPPQGAAPEHIAAKSTVPNAAAPKAIITGKESAHRYASIGDAVPPQTIVKGAGFAIVDPTVWLVFWGSEWTKPRPPVDPNALIAAVKTIVQSDYIAFLKEYNVESLSWGGVYFDSSDPPASFFRGNVQNKVVSLIANGTLPVPNTGNFSDTFYCVMMPSTTTYGPGGEAGEHSAASWKNPKDNHTYSPFVAWIGNGTLDAMTATFSHELVEALTDPQGTWIQVAPASASSWNEICDVCASVAYLDGVAVSSYWSNLEQACVIPVNQFNSLFQYPPAGLSLQVIGAQKAYSTEVQHEWIYAMRCRDNATSIEYDLYRDQVASLIDQGKNTFFVIGGDGSRANVMTGSVNGHAYVKTVADWSTQDNLLSLPPF